MLRLQRVTFLALNQFLGLGQELLIQVREREGERQTERQTERQRETKGETEGKGESEAESTCYTCTCTCTCIFPEGLSAFRLKHS